MAIILTDADVRRATDARGALNALDQAYRDDHAGNTAITERVNLRFERGWLRLMAAALPSVGVVGYKAFHLVGSAVRFQVNLFDITTGEFLAAVDGNHLTVLRTASTACLAAAKLAPTARKVGIIGSGAEARMQAIVISQLLDLDRVVVHSPRRERREQFARDLSERLGVDIEPVADGRTAAENADLILVATNTGGTGPAFYADWIPETVHLSSTGSTLPEERELDSEVWRVPDLVVVDRMQALEESGDAITAIRAGTLDASRVTTLAELCGRPADASRPRRTLFKSVGSPLQDVAVAAYAYRSAQERGLGTALADFPSVKGSVPVLVGGRK
ncbi:ornithine cyclodeaminase family protein [Micromonospora sp. STR1_7]|uniref:Ornithine cyclodeaminase family protein n=1 Tax=Micromonospora parastrephiae TaxID=2806101 RepID=A0ABS1XR43_9ACTN|nr:ornithine cyclodeaminase family protein [Micromonospora parastrephiae]MBM0231727.1 ornithine cyclodeaminase family protein [Micromonospora parastrephiae]